MEESKGIIGQTCLENYFRKEKKTKMVEVLI